MPEKRTFRLTVNNEAREVTAWPAERLLDVLRTELKLTGCKEGCGEGECGACSVLMDGELVNTCLIPVAQAEGAHLRTVESLDDDDLGARLQSAFERHGGAQCGICTPGMLLASYTLLSENPKPSLDQVRTALAGNLCRCTGYMKIFDSVLAAAQENA